MSVEGSKVKYAPSQTWDCTNWDLNTQQPHGGQEWKTLDKFVEDFSVTTNVLGPPWRATAAAAGALENIHHYPPANCEPALTHLAQFIDPENYQAIHSCLCLGNGASELIDLVTRVGSHPGNILIPNATQYKEYERAALASGRSKVEDPDRNSYTIVALVNPCNPTGEYMNIDELKAFIEKIARPGITVLVDESMQPWVGPNWRDDSLVRQRAWVQRMAEEKDIRVHVIHSWTKIWSCPGIRIGSLLAPLPQEVEQIKHHQVPWSVNICALAFLSAAVHDTEYMFHTWEVTVKWRQRTVDALAKLHPEWRVHGEPYLSWLWVDTGSEQAAAAAVARAREAGCPIRDGGMGYKLPTFIRLAVRDPQKQDTLFKALTF